MSDETVMQAGDRQGDRGLPEWRTDTFIAARILAREGEDSVAKHALTYALDVAEKACRERDEARAEVERLRAERDEARDGAIVYRERAYTAEAEVERLRLAVVIKDDRVAALRAERNALREAAQWILHTISGVSRDGGPVTDDECLASYDALRAAIEGEGGSDERE